MYIADSSSNFHGMRLGPCIFCFACVDLVGSIDNMTLMYSWLCDHGFRSRVLFQDDCRSAADILFLLIKEFKSLIVEVLYVLFVCRSK